MKFSCTKENIAQALALVGGVTGKNINLPILSNVLIKANEQKVDLVTTNLELAVIVSIRSKVEEAGVFTVPARTLADFINLLPNEKIDVSLVSNELALVCGKSATKIKGTSAEDYPVIPAPGDGEGYSVDAKLLRDSLGQVVSSAAKNDIRPELSGIFFGFNVGGEGTLTLAATDSYRLAEKKLPLAQGKKEIKIIVPARTAQEINHALAASAESGEPQVRLLVGENQLVVNYNNAQIVSRLVDGQYPDYTQIIPREFKTVATISTAGLTKEMKAAGLFTTTGVNAVTVILDSKTGSIKTSSTSTQTGEYASEIVGEISGEDNTILLNNRYVLDGLSNVSAQEVELKVISADAACVLQPKGDAQFTYIVMPIRQ